MFWEGGIGEVGMGGGDGRTSQSVKGRLGVTVVSCGNTDHVRLGMAAGYGDHE